MTRHVSDQSIERHANGTDPLARARLTAHDGVEAAKDVAVAAAHQAAAVAGAAAGQVQAGVESLRTSLDRRDMANLVRKPMPLALLLAGTAVALVIYLVSRNRG